MTGELTLVPSEDAEDHLWRHGLYVEDVYEVVDEGRYKVFRDQGRTGRLKLIGPDRGGQLITAIITTADSTGQAFLITAWQSDREEIALYSRPGGGKHVRRRS